MSVEVKEVFSKQQTKEANEQTWYDPRIDINLIRDPKRFIYVGTVSKRNFDIERPPLFPKLRVPACAPTERFKMVAKVPDPFNQAIQDTDNGRLRGVAHDGLRVAIDLVNPNNISTNFDWVCPPEAANEVATGYGCDLSKQGVFISLEWPPLEDTLAKAEQRRYNMYESMRRSIDRQNEKDALEMVAMNSDFDMMADFFGLTYTWHKKMQALITCPNCMGQAPQGAAFHKVGDAICVIDWRKAVGAGVKKKEDVPEDARWWSEDEPKSSGSRRGA